MISMLYLPLCRLFVLARARLFDRLQVASQALLHADRSESLIIEATEITTCTLGDFQLGTGPLHTLAVMLTSAYGSSNRG